MSGIEIYVWQKRLERRPKPQKSQTYFRRVKLTADPSGYVVPLSEAGVEFYAPDVGDVDGWLYDQRSGLFYEDAHFAIYECHLSKKKEEVCGERDALPVEQMDLSQTLCLLSGAGGAGAELFGVLDGGIKVYGEPVKSRFGLGRSGAKSTWYPLGNFVPKGMKVYDTTFFWASDQGKAAVWVCALCGSSTSGSSGKKGLLITSLDSLVPGVSPSVPGLPPVLSVPGDVRNVAVDPDAAYVWMLGNEAVYRLHLKSGDAVESFAVDGAPDGIDFWIEDKDHAWVVVACASGNIPLLPVHGSVNAQHPIIKGEPLPKSPLVGFSGVAIRESDGRALITWYPYLERVYIRDVDLKARKVLHHMQLPERDKLNNTDSSEYFLPGWTP
ncbi:YncE family protein [Streptomyces sp. NPDC050161]|uniref:YncE family protein n=1 Tax=Streptomyces sp. NPDC050161 TaxID=3365604 RepID=UPI00379470BC